MKSPSGRAPDLPASIALAWGLKDGPTRGPKRKLTLERVVQAGIDVATSEGLGALSMARLATEIGTSTMSLYRYVAAKDDLMLLMVDAALGAPPSPSANEKGWRMGLTRWAVGVRAAYARSPWALRIPISAPPLGPNNVAWLDDALRSLAGVSLTEEQKLSTVLLISGFVRNEATLTADVTAASGGADVLPGYGVVLSRLIDPVQFPALQQAIESGSLDDVDHPDVEFDFGLARILDGVEVLMKSNRSTQRRSKETVARRSASNSRGSSGRGVRA